MNDHPDREALAEAFRRIIDSAYITATPIPQIVSKTAVVSLLVDAALRADLSRSSSDLLEVLKPFAEVPAATPPTMRCRVVDAGSGPYHFLQSDLDKVREFYRAVFAPTPPETMAGKYGGPPNGYHPLPVGVVCKCFKMWKDGNGNNWCCLPCEVINEPMGNVARSGPCKAGSNADVTAGETAPINERRTALREKLRRAITPHWEIESRYVRESTDEAVIRILAVLNGEART